MWINVKMCEFLYCCSNFPYRNIFLGEISSCMNFFSLEEKLGRSMNDFFSRTFQLHLFCFCTSPFPPPNNFLIVRSITFVVCFVQFVKFGYINVQNTPGTVPLFFVISRDACVAPIKMATQRSCFTCH